MFLLLNYYYFFMPLNSTVAISALVGQNVACMTDVFYFKINMKII